MAMESVKSFKLEME